ncbi:methyltransferase domain-containing protein [Alteromonas sp. 5E99-2]|uniref:methyltransferase domain-containing protein n=1 Tax=Alteromonas sp. 5E99-2 TaxID=2817683 RepID=UPI001A98476B|nr:methyltransferase domain-containing protein [Alteromonas sp. 5E99-2]MBO1256187.1 methyltransferase domain-containing protein [Alteromonas sp. 5E99-2]
MALTHSCDTHLLNKRDIAKRFSKASSQYFTMANIQNTIAIAAKEHIPAINGKILDIGCASGEHTRSLGMDVVGVDLAFGMVRNAQNTPKTPNVSSAWVNADMDALPFRCELFSHVFSSMALQWSKHPVLVLNEIYRVIAPSGGATLVIPVQGAFCQLQQAYEKCGLKSKVLPLQTSAEWLYLATEAGFKISHSFEHVYQDKRDDFRALLKSISKVGASSSTINTSSNQLTKSKLIQLERCYPKVENAFTLDYRCLHMSLEK